MPRSRPLAQRHYSSGDRLLDQLDQALATLSGQRRNETGLDGDVDGTGSPAPRPSPADVLSQPPLHPHQQRRAARLMRVNHTGEICAQALYRGQALTARSDAVRRTMRHAGAEEGDHLAWCQQRIDELQGRASLLNPLFYAGSLALGAAAGLAGDRWSLGFLAETERQVERHLDAHLARLPADDRKSHAVLSAMQTDERRHAGDAERRGAAPLPAPVRRLMRLTSKLMTRSTYWL